MAILFYEPCLLLMTGYCSAGNNSSKQELVVNFIKYLYHSVSICLLEVMLCSILDGTSTLRVHHYFMFHTLVTFRYTSSIDTHEARFCCAYCTNTLIRFKERCGVVLHVTCPPKLPFQINMN